LVEAKLNDKYNSIRDATYGIAFFGTPHQGGKYAELGDIASKVARGFLRNPKNNFLDVLKKDSLFSDELVKNYRHDLMKYHVLSVCETREYKNLGVVCKIQTTLVVKADFLRSLIRSPRLLVFQGP
jgi:hypothetical protein